MKRLASYGLPRRSENLDASLLSAERTSVRRHPCSAPISGSLRTSYMATRKGRQVFDTFRHANAMQPLGSIDRPLETPTLLRGDFSDRISSLTALSVRSDSALFPTTLVGSYPQPDWLIDRQKLAERFPPRVRARLLWRIPDEHLVEAQNDATIVAIRAQERDGVDIVTDGEVRRELLQPFCHRPRRR